MAEPSIDETTRRAQAGDVAAFETIYRDHRGRVWALARRWESDAGRAEDLFQEVFVRVWRALPGFRGRSSLATWIHAVALHACLDRAARRGAGCEAVADAEPVAEPTDHPDPGGSIDLERAIAALPDGQRRMFLLHAVEGMRCREIADRLQVAVGTVQSQVFRARRKLRGALER